MIKHAQALSFFGKAQSADPNKLNLSKVIQHWDAINPENLDQETTLRILDLLSRIVVIEQAKVRGYTDTNLFSNLNQIRHSIDPWIKRTTRGIIEEANTHYAHSLLQSTQRLKIRLQGKNIRALNGRDNDLIVRRVKRNFALVKFLTDRVNEYGTPKQNFLHNVIERLIDSKRIGTDSKAAGLHALTIWSANSTRSEKTICPERIKLLIEALAEERSPSKYSQKISASAAFWFSNILGTENPFDDEQIPATSTFKKKSVWTSVFEEHGYDIASTSNSIYAGEYQATDITAHKGNLTLIMKRGYANQEIWVFEKNKTAYTHPLVGNKTRFDLAALGKAQKEEGADNTKIIHLSEKATKQLKCNKSGGSNLIATLESTIAERPEITAWAIRDIFTPPCPMAYEDRIPAKDLTI